MKKRFLIFTLISIVFIGCSSDSGGNSLPINEQNLSGKWHLKGIKLSDQSYESYDYRCSTSKDYLEFLISHNAKNCIYGANCEVIETKNYSWTLNGNRLTMVDQDPAVATYKVYTVSSITDQQLTLSYDYAFLSEPKSDKYYYTRN